MYVGNIIIPIIYLLVFQFQTIHSANNIKIRRICVNITPHNLQESQRNCDTGNSNKINMKVNIFRLHSV